MRRELVQGSVWEERAAQPWGSSAGRSPQWGHGAELHCLGTVTSSPEGLHRLGACEQAATGREPRPACPAGVYMPRKRCYFPANAIVVFVPATRELVNPSLEGSWNHS